MSKRRCSPRRNAVFSVGARRPTPDQPRIPCSGAPRSKRRRKQPRAARLFAHHITAHHITIGYIPIHCITIHYMHTHSSICLALALSLPHKPTKNNRKHLSQVMGWGTCLGEVSCVIPCAAKTHGLRLPLNTFLGVVGQRLRTKLGLPHQHLRDYIRTTLGLP